MYIYIYIYIYIYTVKFEILAWNYYFGDISEWVRFANITIRLYLYHFSTIFHFAQASKRVSVFEGHFAPAICHSGVYVYSAHTPFLVLVSSYFVNKNKLAMDSGKH